MFYTDVVSNKITSLKRSVDESFDNALERAFHGGMFSLIMITLVWVAIFMYVIFYYAYVPAPSYTRPVHLQVEVCKDASIACPFPSAHVRLTRRHQLLMMGQQYKFSVQMEMPESPVNKNLGMFMVCIRLADRAGFLTSQSCRSGMLQYHSDLLYKTRVILLSPLFILGAKEEKQVLNFELYSDFEEDQNHPVTDVYVEVQAHEIEIYSATLNINANLVGMRYFMYYWPTTSAFFGILFNICVVFFTTSLSFYHNFFVDTVPVQLLKAQFRRLESREDDRTSEHRSSTSSSIPIGDISALEDVHSMNDCGENSSTAGRSKQVEEVLPSEKEPVIEPHLD